HITRSRNGSTLCPYPTLFRSRDVYLCFMSPRANVEASKVPVRKQLWATAFPQIAPIISGIAEHGRYDFYELARLERWWIGKVALDRKSTRLNSSHVKISYAVF